MPGTPSEQGSTERLPTEARPGAPEARCWVFDVDGCLVDSLSGTSLRPGARRLLEYLSRRRCTVLLWSAGGASYAQSRAEAFDLAGLVTSCHAKGGRDASGSYETGHLPLGDARVVFVDDHPEDLSALLDVMPVSPYLSHDPYDRGLEAVLRRVGLD
jgi:long-chain acyl-CoA synthetase